jgi:hypothetical protein
LQGLLTRALEKVRLLIKSPVLHWLRHSWANRRLKSGTDFRYIQELLGLSISKTTEIYTHVSSKNLQQIRSPFDDLAETSSLDIRKQTFAYTTNLADWRRFIAAINELPPMLKSQTTQQDND